MARGESRSATRRTACEHVAVPVVSSFHFLLAPLVAAATLGVIILLCRWVFSTDTRDGRALRRLERVAAAGDYGLLVPVARVRTREDATMLRDVLGAAGLRASVSTGELPAQHLVLVFRADAERARQLVSARS